uniref:PEHE domain-containing protein n=1 Tax=Anopheles funestus TaxID=62324 RepID=A0A182R5T1_ANOFN
MGLAVIASGPVKKRSDAVEDMAPALTEPLSQSKLSSSAASGASPRTSSSTTTTATTTFDGTTTIITSPDNVHSELDHHQQQQTQQLEEFIDAQEHHHPSLTIAETVDVSETVVVTSTTTALQEEDIVPGGGVSQVQGSTAMSLLLDSSDGVGSTTVDDIQNNNSGEPGLKIDADTNRDLIELALEQLHQDPTMGGGGNGNETPAVDSMAVTNVVDMASVTSHSAMPAHILQPHPHAQHPSGDLMPLDSPPTQMIVSQGSFPDAQQLQQPQQQQQQIQQMSGSFMNIPIQDSSQSSSSLTGMGISGTSELGMQLKDSNEVDQMIRELSTADIDLLQVFKSFDNNSLLLFSDVDVANLCDVPVGDGSQSQSSPNKDRERLEQRAEILKLQAQMQRKQDFLARRLSKLKARYMGQHVSEEVAGLFEYTQRFWKKREKENAKHLHNMNNSINSGNSAGLAVGNVGSNVASTMGTLSGEGSSSWPEIIPFQAPPPDQTPEKLKPISANALKTFAKRLESLANTICSEHSKRVLDSRYFHGVSTIGSGASSAFPAPSTSGADLTNIANISNTIPMFERSAMQELEQTAGMLYAELRQVQSTIDSDATLSSSGGESADESMPYTNNVQEPLPITERAAWRWAIDRAAVASKWTWLWARVADLEYRIRQHGEVLNKIRVNKGPVALEELCVSGDQQQQQSQQSVNGYRGQLPGSSKPLTSQTTLTDDEDADIGSSCSRTRPYCRTQFRKRKLMQTHNLHTVSKRAAKPSNVKCGCQWPLLPCALCTGRTDPTALRDSLDTLTFSERVALLDASFHPVLSFPEDISYSIHLEAIMRTPEWQSKMIRSKATSASFAESSVPGSSSRGAFFSSGDEMTPSSHGKRYTSSDGKRKYESMTSNKYKNNDRYMSDGGNKSKKAKSKRDVILSNSRKSGSGYSYDGSRSGSNGHRNNNKHQPGVSKSRKSSHCYDYYDGNDGGVSRSRNTSPTPNNRHERRYRNSSAYDIGSIVIPQSMAASTRVSIPQYKDIAVPKWRIVGDNEDADESVNNQLNSSDIATSNDQNMIITMETELSTEGNPNILKSPVKSDSSIPPNGTKTTVPVATPSTSGYIEPVQQQQQLIVIPAQDEEDISDEAIMLKHDRALQEERKKFRTYLKFPWSRPRAKRRTDSRAGSSGGNTPDPTSPAPPTPMVDHDSSPACPSTPITPQDGQELSEANVINALNKSLHKKERRRTVSSKREDQQTQGAGTTTPDTREVVSPYEALQFPLADNIFEEMVRSMPSDHLDNECLSKLTGRNGLPFRRSMQRNNNILLKVNSSVNLAPASLGMGSENPLSSNASTATTVSATETDMEDFDDEDLMLAKRMEKEIIMQRLLNSRSESQQYEIVPPSAKPMLDDDEDVIDDEETDTGESLFVEEDDPNDPEWHDRPVGRSGGAGGCAGGSNGAGNARV